MADTEPKVLIRIGRAYEVMRPERVAATEAFADDLRRWGLTVKVEVTEYVPGRVGLGPVEWTGIFIGQSVAASLISSLVDDLYEAAKDYLRKRKRSGKSRPNLGVTIYGPDGEPLRKWTTKEDDEAED
jgi:hypothetical protein